MFLPQTPIVLVLEVDIFKSYFLAILFSSFTAIHNKSSDFVNITLSSAYSTVWILYADDQFIIAKSKDELQHVTNLCN
jgi:hypothetical protein